MKLGQKLYKVNRNDRNSSLKDHSFIEYIFIGMAYERVNGELSLKGPLELVPENGGSIVRTSESYYIQTDYEEAFKNEGFYIHKEDAKDEHSQLIKGELERMKDELLRLDTSIKLLEKVL